MNMAGPLEDKFKRSQQGGGRFLAQMSVDFHMSDDIP